MSLLDLASLVLAPTATKEGKVYSAIPDTGDGDMTFTRGSSATRINSAGLIEKERANLLLQSNSFNTTWAKSVTATLTSGQTGYDGSSNAWLFGKDATGFINLNQAISSLTGVGTLSIYAKANTNSNIIVRCIGGTDAQGFFDLSNGTLAAPSANCIDTNIEDVGNGWYRCSITFNTSSTTSVNLYPDYPFGGTNAGNIYIQDAQLEQGLVATDYIETTTSAVYEGITDDVPRVDYSGGGCPSLLLESQRTNLVPHSEYFGDWGTFRSSITANDATSPEGLTNSYKLIQQSGETTSGGVYKNISVSTSTTYTYSFFAKAAGYNWSYARVIHSTDNFYAWFDLDNGVVGNTTGSGVTSSIEDYGSGWYKCSITYTSTTTSASLNIYIADTNGSGTISNPDGVKGIHIYGAMVEAGSYSTSYIPTYSVSSTRVADSCSKTGISELIGQSEGTVHIEFDNNQLSTYPNEYIYQIVDGTTELWIRKESGGSGFTARLIVSGSTIWTIGIIPPDGLTKIATAYKSGDSVIYMNGSVVGSVNTSTFSGSSFADLNFFRSTLKPELYLNQAILFPTRLTNDQLEELTK